MKKPIVALACVAAMSAVFAQEEFDVVIYGSSPAALTAAIEAQDLGKTAVIVSPETRIGGLTTGGLGQTDIGNKSAFGGLALQFYRDVADYYKDGANWKWQKRGDYIPDGQCAGTKGEDSMWTFEPSAALKILTRWEKERKLVIHRGKRLCRERGKVKVERRGGGEQRIVSFLTVDGTEYRGKVFVDATYEGDLLAAAGCSYAVGRESNATYGETANGNAPDARGSANHNFRRGVDPYVVKGDPGSGLLPNVEPFDPDAKAGDGDRRVQAYCFRMCLTDVPENRIPFAKPDGYRELDYELLLRNFEAGEGTDGRMPWINSKMPNRKTDTNNRTGFSTDFIGRNWAWPEASYAERAKILKEHLDYQRGLMWTLANHPRVPENVRREVSRWGTCRDEFADGLGDGWQGQLYVREGRRLVGEYVMTEHNCRGERTASRPVSLGAYGMDSHHVRRIVTKDGFVRNEGNVEDRMGSDGKTRFPPYPIDYGAIVPKRAECGNLIVPVCLSASHIAFGSIRMEPVFFSLGQVAGASASIAIDSGKSVQDIDYPTLRARLESDGLPLRFAASAAEIDLVTARIEVADPKNPTQKLAAEELEKHLKLVAGERRPAKDGYRFVIGQKPLGGKDASDWMSFAQAADGAMYFWGDDTRISKGDAHKGSLFGVYGFLERLVGVIWTKPGDDGIIFRPKTKISVPPDWTYSFYPPLGMSTLRAKVNTHAWMEMNNECPNALRITDEIALARGTDAWLWNLRQRHQTREVFKYHHAFVPWNPKYIHTHPEYLAMDEKGVRGNPKGPDFNGKRVQICLSNPAVQDQIIADWLAGGTNEYLNVCPNDSHNHCRCKDCCAWDADEPGEDFKATKSDRYVKFWNVLTEKAIRHRPDVKLVTYIYANWRKPPRRERIGYPDNFIAGIVPSIYEDSCPLIEAWRKLGMKKYFVRPNYLCYGAAMPRGLERFLVEDFKSNLELGMMGVDEDNWRRGQLMNFEFYAMARIIANPSLTFERIEREFLTQFGPAWREMQEYYSRVRTRGEAARLKIARATGGVKQKALDDSLLSGSAYDGHTEADLNGDLAVIDRALARTDLSAAERRRVREVRLTVEHAILALRFVTLSTAGHEKADFMKAGDELLDFRFAHKDELIDNWGQVMRCFPIEVRLWMRMGIRKRFPEMKEP